MALKKAASAPKKENKRPVKKGSKKTSAAGGKSSAPRRQASSFVSADMYEALINSINGIIWEADAETLKFSFVSKQAERLLGYPVELWLNENSFWTAHIHPEDRAWAMEYRLSQKRGLLPYEFSYRMIAADGRVVWVKDIVTVEAVNGAPKKLRGVMVDITSQKEIEEKLRFDVAQRRKVDAALREQNEFLYLLNDMTSSLMVSENFNALIETLLGDMVKLLKADACFINGWDEAEQRVFPIATTAEMDFSKVQYPPGEKNLTKSALDAGMVIIAEDMRNTPYSSPVVTSQFQTKSAICIPLIFGSHKLGAVIVGFDKEYHRFTPEEVQRAKQAGDQIAIAMWNVMQEEDLKRYLRQNQLLADISVALSETERIGLNNVLDLIVKSAVEIIPRAEQAVIHLLDEEKGMLVSAAVIGFEEREGGKRNMRIGEGVAGHVVQTGETINISNVNTDTRFVKLGVEPSYSSLLVTAVQSGSKILGSISAQGAKPYAFTDNDINLLRQLGVQAAIAIENAKLLDNTKQALKEVNALYSINQRLAQSLETDELMQDTVELLQKNFGYYYVQIFVEDPETGNFIMRAGSGEIGEQLKKQAYQLQPGEGIVGYTAETGAAFFTNNVDSLFSFVRNPLLPNTQSELAVPVKLNGKIVGLLDIHQAPPCQLSSRDVNLVNAVADQLAIALQKANLYENLQISLQQEKAIRSQLMQNERLTVMGKLLATVSHELNNPLQAIQNALFLLKEEKGISPQGRQDLQIVLAESERMAGMIERLRATYRPIHEDEFQPAQINKIIEDVHALISTHLRHSHIAFEFHPDPELPQVCALADQLRQVVLNLMMNAVEAMQNGGRLAVCTQYLPEDEQVLLTIADTGPGIPNDLLPFIFEAFVTNKPNGTGLGLTISYDIVMKHRGKILAENGASGGAVFKVWLPLRNGEIKEGV